MRVQANNHLGLKPGLNIVQCLAKNRVMSDESYFATDTVVRHEVKKFCL